MDDISSGSQLAISTATRDYDSDRDGSSGFAGMLGLSSGDDGKAKIDEIVKALIEECVQEFLAKICAHQVVIVEELKGGKSKIVGEGNKFAAAGEYDDALERYEIGISTNPDDHECVFNAGVMNEALGNFAKKATSN